MGLAKLGSLATNIFSFRWLASILLLLVFDLATWLAFKPGGGPQVIDQQDKVLHAIGFCGLYILGYISLHFDWFPRVKPPAYGLHCFNAVIWVTYGLFIEAVQRFLPYRNASLEDLLANALGIGAGFCCIFLLRLYPPVKSEHP